MSEEIKDKKMHGDNAKEPVGAAVAEYNDVMLLEDNPSDTPLDKYGFYTDDPLEFEKRVASFEADLDEVDAGIDDPNKWIQVDDFMAAMRKEHAWL